MKRFWIVTAIAVGTALGMVALTLVFGDPSHEVAGMRVLCGGNAEPCWIAFAGVGVLVFGAGVGVVEIGLYGVGLLFATGQLAAGAIAVGQLGVGFIFYFGQVGAGLTGAGQGVLSWLSITQVHTSDAGRRFIEGLSGEVNELLRFGLR